MCPITGDLADMFGDVLVAQPGSVDGLGAWTASGSALNPVCHIVALRGGTLIRDAGGNEVVSSYKVIVGANPTLGLTVDGHRYDLPSRFSPRTELTALKVDYVSDEDGDPGHHERVWFK